MNWCTRRGLLVLEVLKFFNFFTYYNFPFPTLDNKEVRLASNMEGCREQYKKHTGSSIFPAPFSVTYVKPSMPSAFLHSLGLLAFGWGDLENSVALLPHMTNVVIEPTKHLDGLVKKLHLLIDFLLVSCTQKGWVRKLQSNWERMFLPRRYCYWEEQQGGASRTALLQQQKAPHPPTYPFWAERRANLSYQNCGVPELPRPHCSLPQKQAFKLKGEVGEGWWQQTKQHVILSFPTVFPSFLLPELFTSEICWVSFYFDLLWKVIQSWFSMTKPNQNKKTLVLHTFLRSCFCQLPWSPIEALLPVAGFLPGTDACKRSCVILH